MIDKSKNESDPICSPHSSRISREKMKILLGEPRLKICCPVCCKPMCRLYGEDDSIGQGSILTNKCGHCGHIIGVNVKTGEAIEVSPN
jgi:hypothetical protein